MSGPRTVSGSRSSSVPASFVVRYPDRVCRTQRPRAKATLKLTTPCFLVGGDNSITSPRTSSNHRPSFSGRLTNSRNSSAVIRAVAVAVLMPRGSVSAGGVTLPARPPPGQGQRPVYHHRLAERRRDHVGQPRERVKDLRRGPL